MTGQDVEYIQIINIIKRGQMLVLQAKKSGADTKKAEELIKEARYALKMGKREQAVDYAKKCMLDVIRSKRQMDMDELTREGALDKLTKEELRIKCKEMGLDSVGLKEELIERLRQKLDGKGESPSGEKKTDEGTPKEAMKGEKTPKGEPKKEEAKKEKKEDWDPQKDADNLIPGYSYLVEEQRAERSFILYRTLRDKGKEGYSITRTNPNLLQRTFGIEISEITWLTDREVGGDINSLPPSLESIIYSIEEFMDDNKDGVILLDGVEYLIGNNTFNPVIRFLRRLVDKVSTTECVLLVSLAPRSMDPSQVVLMERDLYPLKYL